MCELDSRCDAGGIYPGVRAAFNLLGAFEVGRQSVVAAWYYLKDVPFFMVFHPLSLCPVSVERDQDIVQAGVAQAQGAAVALLYSETSDVWVDVHTPGAALRSLYLALRHAELPVDIVIEQGPLCHRIILRPIKPNVTSFAVEQAHRSTVRLCCTLSNDWSFFQTAARACCSTTAPCTSRCRSFPQTLRRVLRRGWQVGEQSWPAATPGSWMRRIGRAQICSGCSGSRTKAFIWAGRTGTTAAFSGSVAAVLFDP